MGRLIPIPRMLTSLYIKNYALIDELTVDFSSGLVIITGETGAGKSIIIDALGLILGERASAEAVRSGADKAVVEALFGAAGNKKLKAFFHAQTLEWADTLIVRREISIRGQSRSFVNDSPATLALLKEVGEMLVDLHGQHEHQSLLRKETHVDLLDEFGGLSGMVDEFQSGFAKLGDIASCLSSLKEREQQLLEKKELYEFQIQEIDAVTPQHGEEEKLEAELKILENSEKLFAASGTLYELLYNGEQSVRDLLSTARNQLAVLAGIDKQFEDAAKECASAEAIVGELGKFVQQYIARVEFNPERLENIRERLGKLTLLKRKYGGSVDAVISHREKIGLDVDLAGNFQESLAAMEKEIEEQRMECGITAGKLSSKRQEAAKKLDKAVIAELSKLGISNGNFRTMFSRNEVDASFDHGRWFAEADGGKARLNSNGCDEVEFFISTNKGEEPKPLTKVASGGEISRIMLALKSMLAKSDRLPVLIFDEIDVGVSGRVAQQVGMSLKALSSFHQVIAITHLPQIAALADAHYVVTKREDGGRARTTLRKLDLEERVREVAKLMSGAEVTEAGMRSAKELMKSAKAT